MPPTLQKEAVGLSGIGWNAQAEDKGLSNVKDGSIAKKVCVLSHLHLCCTQVLAGKAR